MTGCSLWRNIAVKFTYWVNWNVSTVEYGARKKKTVCMNSVMHTTFVNSADPFFIVMGLRLQGLYAHLMEIWDTHLICPHPNPLGRDPPCRELARNLSKLKELGASMGICGPPVARSCRGPRGPDARPPLDSCSLVVELRTYS